MARRVKPDERLLFRSFEGRVNNTGGGGRRLRLLFRFLHHSLKKLPVALRRFGIHAIPNKFGKRLHRLGTRLPGHEVILDLDVFDLSHGDPHHMSTVIQGCCPSQDTRGRELGHLQQTKSISIGDPGLVEV
jgi:hypothetical protein